MVLRLTRSKPPKKTTKKKTRETVPGLSGKWSLGGGGGAVGREEKIDHTKEGQTLAAKRKVQNADPQVKEGRRRAKGNRENGKKRETTQP